MAQEITVTGSLSITNGSLKSSMAPTSIKPNQTTQLAQCGAVSCPTADTVFDLTGITANSTRWVMIQNLDPTNYVEFGPTSGGAIIPMIKLLAGEFCLFPMSPSVVLRSRANTAAVKVRFEMYDT